MEKVPGSGRSKGTKNKSKKQLAISIKMLLEDKFDDLQTYMDLLKPSEYCRLYVDLLKYAIPAKQAVAVKDETEEKKLRAYGILSDLRKGIVTNLDEAIRKADEEDEADDSE
jgi:hypothetical protein